MRGSPSVARGDPLRMIFAGYRRALGWVALFSGVMNLLMLAGSIYMLQVYDRVLASHSVPTLVALTSMLLAVFLVQGLIDVTRQRLLTRIGAAIDRRRAPDIFALTAEIPVRAGARHDALQPSRDLDAIRTRAFALRGSPGRARWPTQAATGTYCSDPRGDRGLEGPGDRPPPTGRADQAELADIRELFRQNLVPRTRLIELERDAPRLDGEIGQFTAERARAEGRIAETELQVIQIEQHLRREVSSELRDVQMKLGELAERRVAAEDPLKSIDIRAPQSGFVHQLAYHTIGGVVQAGQPIMQVVPGDDRLVIEIRSQPQDIHHVAPGQSAFIRLTAFPQRTTSEMEGSVIRISADIARDAQSQMPFYLARVAVEEGELTKLRGLKIIRGMPAEVFVPHGE